MNNPFDKANNSFTYSEFIDHLNQLMAEGKTTGLDQSEKYLHYAKLNLQRMKRWDKTFELNDELKLAIQKTAQQQWWVITEGWCGDSAQNLPAIQKMAEASNGQISLRIILRDDNLEIMDQYLTNGTSRSIPVLVAFDQNNQPLFRWGPRPAEAQALFTEWKNSEHPESFEDFELTMHTWYTQNKGAALQQEFMAILQN